uniref:TGF-beta family profile domain-containing protein n=1 Tax=Ascaris lumbricoides TaxID=6252 RepID=A0A9J2PSN0_ASCLU
MHLQNIFIFFSSIFSIVWSYTATGFYVDNEDAQSIPLPVNQKGGARLQSKILELLGIEEPVPSGGGVKDELASRFMAELYRNLEQDVELNPAYKYLESGQSISAAERKAIELGEADTIVSFLPRDMDYGTRLRFDLDDIQRGSRLLHAELRVSFNSPLKPARLTAFIPTNRESERIGSAEWLTSGSGHFVFNITEALLRWTRNPAFVPAITLFALTPRGILKDENNGWGWGFKRSLDSYGVWHSFAIASFVDKNGHGRDRVKRDASSEASTAFDDYAYGFSARPDPLRQSDIFQRFMPSTLVYMARGFYDALTKDWVIAPDGYHAYYCDGYCSFPLNNHMNATNHAIVQTLVHLIDPTRTSEAKCAPSALRSMKILFIDNAQNVVLKRYQDMQVVRTSEAKCAPSALRSMKILFIDNAQNVVLKRYQDMQVVRTSEAKCAPSALRSMKILFIDNAQNVVLKRYQDMQVRECGCQ